MTSASVASSSTINLGRGLELLLKAVSAYERGRSIHLINSLSPPGISIYLSNFNSCSMSSSQNTGFVPSEGYQFPVPGFTKWSRLIFHISSHIVIVLASHFLANKSYKVLRYFWCCLTLYSPLPSHLILQKCEESNKKISSPNCWDRVESPAVPPGIDVKSITPSHTNICGIVLKYLLRRP